MSQNRNLFTTVKLNRPRRNSFDMTHDVKTSFNMGWLVPIMCMDAIPGDHFRIGNDAIVRFQPLISPVMHRFDVTCHYFFVPKRILWDGWEKWIVNDPTALAHPFVNCNDATYYAIHDYLGIPTPPNTGETERISALPFAAYQMIYNEYYRDQNLIPEVDYKAIPGNNDINNAYGQLRRRAWEHDYFTSALPFAQKGAAVDIPLGTGIVEYHNDGSNPNGTWRIPSAGDAFADGHVENTLLGGAEADGSGSTPANTPIAYDPQGTLKVDVGNQTINDLRRAFRLQEWLERNARVGTRYTESILGHFGVKSDDARLQRPEYITGTKTPVIISEVLNTAGAARPQGDMAGHAVSVSQGHYGSYYAKEHGYVMGIMSIMPRTAYYQGIPKHFLNIDDPFQLPWPEFANLGEEEVLNKEIYAYQGAASDDVFGYVPRYASYKYHPSTVHGQFRNTLEFWHAARKFSAPPALNQAFVECDPTFRIFAVTDPNEDAMLAQVLNKVTVSRLLPKFGTPTF